MPNYIEAIVVDGPQEHIIDSDTVVIDVKEELYEPYTSDSDVCTDSGAETDVDSEYYFSEPDIQDEVEQNLDEYEKHIENSMICCMSVTIITIVCVLLLYYRLL